MVHRIGEPGMILNVLHPAKMAEVRPPRLSRAVIAPERGMMLVELAAELGEGREVNLVAAPPPAEVPAAFGGADDFAGNASFALGGAILLPYANRIRGRALPDSREIETVVLGKRLRLPRNWGGRKPGAEHYAMHGLILDRRFEVMEERAEAVRGMLRAGDFGGRWPSSTDIVVHYRLTPAALELRVEAANAGDEPLPIGIGWHPYFAIPSGRRGEARLRVPAAGRAAVNNYDEVLPTGAILPVAGTPYDFTAEAGRPLGAAYLDDCFVGLAPVDGKVSAALVDPTAGLGVRIVADAPPVTAFQVYAPPDKPFAAIEPQFNLADPFGPEWRGADTGMVVLRPGERTVYAVRVEVFAV
jgi:galactose mutarotase-like enzyme